MARMEFWVEYASTYSYLSVARAGGSSPSASELIDRKIAQLADGGIQ